jgi:hypothetical protein
MRSLADGFEKFARGMVFWVADDGDTDAETSGGGALGNGLQRVIGSFGMDVRAKIFEERLDTRFTKEDDVIHGAKRSDEKSSCIFIKDGTAEAFQSADAQIRVHSHDENVPFEAGAFEIADVADVKRIEAAVGENDLMAMLFVLR